MSLQEDNDMPANTKKANGKANNKFLCFMIYWFKVASLSISPRAIRSLFQSLLSATRLMPRDVRYWSVRDNANHCSPVHELPTPSATGNTVRSGRKYSNDAKLLYWSLQYILWLQQRRNSRVSMHRTKTRPTDRDGNRLLVMHLIGVSQNIKASQFDYS